LLTANLLRIQDHLLHSLNANPSNWPTAVSDRALALLRTGEVTTFPALLKRVLDEVRAETLGGPSASNGDSNSSASNSKKINGSSAASATQGLAVPKAVVDDALKVTRAALESIVDVEESRSG
jgi:hypothetical protein